MKKIVLLGVLITTLFTSGCSAETQFSESAAVAFQKYETAEEQSDDNAPSTSEMQEDSEIIKETYYKSALNKGITNSYNSVNNKNQYLPSVCCFIEETDTMFFSDGERLYQKNGDNINILADINAISINLIDGWLYFVKPDKSVGNVAVGNVYKFSLETHELIEVYEGNARHISYNGNRLIVMTTEAEQINGNYVYSQYYYSCDLNGDNSEKLSCVAVNAADAERAVRHEYVISADEYEYFYTLYTDNTTQKICDITENISLSHVAFCDDNIYWLSENFSNLSNITRKIARYDITSGEIKELKLSEYIVDYTIIDNQLYIYTGKFYVVDSNLNIIESIDNEDKEQDKKTKIYDAVYGCGEDIFVLDGNNLLKIEFTDDETKLFKVEDIQ